MVWYSNACIQLLCLAHRIACRPRSATYRAAKHHASFKPHWLTHGAFLIPAPIANRLSYVPYYAPRYWAPVSLGSSDGRSHAALPQTCVTSSNNLRRGNKQYTTPGYAHLSLTCSTTSLPSVVNMGEFYDEIPDDPKLIEWIKKQVLFHVATAPLNGGRVNVSPKGFASFKLVNRRACWYLDLTGSGNETISHLYEPGNGRITVLFEAFEGPPRLLRLFGRGTVFERGTPEFDAFFNGERTDDDDLDWPTPELMPGTRSIIWIDITKVGTSCGYTVPKMQYLGERQMYQNLSKQLEKVDATAEDPYAAKGLKSYILDWNTWSIDGLPGVRTNASRVSRKQTRQFMAQHGLNPAKEGAGRGMRYARVVAFLALLLGVVLGMLLTVLVQENSVRMHRILRDIRSIAA
ncbi:hypothetical protein NM688_g7943 [Phlebia brevispora]|uniref:Uncharacterized protein n=1 Tax=Phlebia brevispora TaxID=194682 RepID=A0ACC1RZA9_9APHY|nr:hypothetical protein NM688_g7943 [Phlebia brevispora]